MRSGSTASWAVPANTSTLIATACGCVRPALTIATPATIPQGTIPTRSPAEARAPSRSSEICSRCIFRFDDPVASSQCHAEKSAHQGVHDTQRPPGEPAKWACCKADPHCRARARSDAICNQGNPGTEEIYRKASSFSISAPRCLWPKGRKEEDAATPKKGEDP